jgi:nuclear pore complex protein Nup160
MAAATAADKVLVSTHLSDVYSPLQTAAISISTSKPHVPFPPQATDDEPPPEHAQYASFFHSVQTGVILLRLIHNGLIVELVSLSTETPPIRFVFPYTVLPNPAVVLWETRELHILAVTASGSLFRIVLPLHTPQQLWSSHMVNNWCREYHLKYVKEDLQALVQVQGTHSVALALTNGSLIRLDAENIGDKTSAGASMFLAFSPLLFSSSIPRPLDREPVSPQYIPRLAHVLPPSRLCGWITHHRRGEPPTTNRHWPCMDALS